MNRREAYELLDFGQGRKLERFGPVWVDRPSPAADGVSRRHPAIWSRAQLRYVRQEPRRGTWTGRPPEPWTVAAGPFHLQLRPTPAGQIGIFPEQWDNWAWIDRQCRRAEAPRVLNLFAYTGAATLAAAAAGAQAVHVDASRPVVAWARRNAQSSALDHLPIRWLVEDAETFVDRELRRGRRYQALILDPPSYGHGRRGATWQLDRDLPRLLEKCIDLLADDARFLLATCHSPGYDADRLAELATQCGLPTRGDLRPLNLTLATADGRQLPSGFGIRWSSDEATPCIHT